ncbi:hypothetical protein [Prevotellamassilia timonensis]|uniref:hypothetical protein n=1 Tax=Prevotellamassilia timonensis TaxID=1852370 RepID=UPI0008D9DEEF|nr:hypothetical protein [Prevotellamassilia timonensis]
MEHKLGIVIQAANQGNQEIFQSNKEQSWANSIHELRKPMNGLTFSKDDTEPAIYVEFLGEKGYLLALVFSDRARDADNATVWVHVPAACNISSAETVEVIERIKEVAKTGNFKSNPIFDEIADKTYQDKGVLVPAVSTICSAPKASKYGVRRLSNFTLKELFGNNIAQHEYAKYKGIFLLNQSVGFGNDFEELGAELKKVRTLQAPKSQEGFEPYIVVAREDVPFTKAVEYPDGADVCIKWKKEGYKSISKKAKVTDKEEDFQNSIKIDAKEDIYKEVHCDNIKVYGSDGSPIDNFKVLLNRLPQNRTLYVPTRGECQITIKADEYEDKDVTLKGLTSDKGIKLEKKLHHYRFALEGSKEEYILTTQRRLTKSPIKGYSADDDISEKDVNHLSYGAILQKIMYFGIGFGACLLAVGLYVGWNVFVMDREFKFVDKQAAGVTATQDEDDTLTDTQKALNYLQNNDTWHKDSLDRFDATHGLFDELNEFEVNKIKDRNATLNNDKLGKIVEALEQIPADSRPGTHDGKYNTKDDKQININNYINSITNTATPQSQTTPSVPQQNDVPTQAPAPDPAPASPRSHSKGQTIRPASAQNKKPAKKNAKKATDKSGAGKNDGTDGKRGSIKK